MENSPTAKDYEKRAESAGVFRPPASKDPDSVLRWLDAAQDFLESPGPSENKVNQVGRIIWDLGGEMPSLPHSVAAEMTPAPPFNAWGTYISLRDACVNLKILRSAIGPKQTPNPPINVGRRMDTRPTYPEPNPADVDVATRELISVFEHIPPQCCVTADLLVRAVISRGHPTAAAMWAIHRLIDTKIIGPFDIRELPPNALLITDQNPPAGLTFKSGPIYMFGANDDDIWPYLAILARRADLEMIRFLHSMNGESTATTISKEENSESDSEPDQQKKPEKKRRVRTMTIAAADCVRLYKKAKKRDATVKMQGIVDEYVEKNGGSVAAILRCLSDNKDQWR